MLILDLIHSCVDLRGAAFRLDLLSLLLGHIHIGGSRLVRHLSALGHLAILLHRSCPTTHLLNSSSLDGCMDSLGALKSWV